MYPKTQCAGKEPDLLPQGLKKMQENRTEYDFSNRNPGDPFTSAELEHFEEGMRLKNNGKPAEDMDFGRGVDAVVTELNSLLP